MQILCLVDKLGAVGLDIVNALQELLLIAILATTDCRDSPGSCYAVLALTKYLGSEEIMKKKTSRWGITL